MNIISEAACARDVGDVFNVSRESFAKLRQFAELLAKWQKTINLVGPKELPRMWSRHIADGLQLVEHLPQNARHVVDLGSGAGLPGLVLAIALAERDGFVHLVESNGKKAAFMRDAIRKVEINAKVHCARIEDVYGEPWVANIDVVTARALAPLPLLMKLAVPFVDRGAENSGEMLFLKGQDVDSELTQTTKYWNMKYDCLPSRTNAAGCILRIKDFRHVSGSHQ